MVEIPNKVRETIDRYILLLEENNIPIKSLYLYGSYAKGTSRRFSDIDIAIVSKEFEGVRIRDRKKIRSITLQASSELEVIPFNPEDFSVDNPFAREIIETGIKII